MPTIITFLNDKGLRADAVYRWEDQVYPGGVFCLALREFVPHDRMLVCNTPEAEKITWPHIAALNDPRIEPVPIPKGESTAELWDLFDKIAARKAGDPFPRSKRAIVVVKDSVAKVTAPMGWVLLELKAQ